MMVWKIKNHVDPVILSENILALCQSNYELISKGNRFLQCNRGMRKRLCVKLGATELG